MLGRMSEQSQGYCSINERFDQAITSASVVIGCESLPAEPHVSCARLAEYDRRRLVYDDDCGFCTWWADFIEDRSDLESLGSLRSATTAERLPTTTSPVRTS